MLNLSAFLNNLNPIHKNQHQEVQVKNSATDNG